MNNEEKEKYLRKIMQSFVWLGVLLILPVVLSFIMGINSCASGDLEDLANAQKFLNWFNIPIYVLQVTLCFRIANYIFRILNPNYVG